MTVIVNILTLAVSLGVLLGSAAFPGSGAMAEVVFFEDWESGIGTWYVTNGQWQVGVPTAGPDSVPSGVNCAGTVLGGDYSSLANTHLVSPRITLREIVPGERIRLTFWHWFSTQHGVDFGAADVSDDNGSTFYQVSPNVYEGESLTWTKACVDVSEYAGTTIRLGFHFLSDDDWPTGYVGPGWYVDDISVEIGSFTLSVPGAEDFELGIGDWCVDNGLWEVGTPSAGPDTTHSGSSCVGTVLGGNYAVQANTRLISPYIDVPTPALGERVRLRFWHWFSTQHGPDFGQVQVRPDTSATWRTISAPAYEGDGKVWTQACADLSEYGGQTVQVAFLFTSDDDWPTGYVGPGWYVDDISVEIGSFTLSVPGAEDFELGIGDWCVDNGLWEVGTPSAGPDTTHSGSSCVGTVLGGNYAVQANTRLISPYIDVPTPALGERVRLRFWHWFSTQHGPDFGQVQVRPDTSATWRTISAPAYEGDGKVWTQACADLSEYGGQTVQVAFLFTSDDDWPTGYVGSGWYVDDVSIEARRDSFNFLPYPEYMYLEDFEQGTGDWCADNGLWEVGIPHAGPGGAYLSERCAGTVLDGDYAVLANTRLVTPEAVLFPAPGAEPELFFWHWFYTQPGVDVGELQIKVRGGSWESLTAPGTPYSGDSGGWTRGYADLSAYADSTVQIAFYFTSDDDWPSGYVAAGWYIDDVSIEGTIDTGLPADGAFYASLTESGDVLLRWSIASLTGIEYLDVYRATSCEGPFERINERPLTVFPSGTYVDTSTWPETTFWYQLTARLVDGSEDTVGNFLATVTTPGRLALSLYAPEPNPTRSVATIAFDVPNHAGSITLTAYNSAGQVVRTLWNGPIERGRHTIQWDGCDDGGRRTASGVYFLRLCVDGMSDGKKILMLR